MRVHFALATIGILRDSDGVRHDLEFEPGIVDFGRTNQKAELSGTVLLRNRTSQPIQVVNVHSSCSCAAVATGMLGSSIPASQAIEIPVKLQTGQSRGILKQRITVLYVKGGSDQATKSVNLEFVADVVPDYVSDPEEIDFGEIDNYDPAIRTLKVIPVGLARIRVEGVESNSKEFTVRRTRSEGALEAVSELEVVYSASDRLKSAEIRGAIVITTDSPRAPTHGIVAKARFVSPIEIHPDSLVCRYETDAPIQRTVAITTRATSKLVWSKVPSFVEIHKKDEVEAKNHSARIQINRPPTGTRTSALELTVILAPGLATELRKVFSIPIYFVH